MLVVDPMPAFEKLCLFSLYRGSRRATFDATDRENVFHVSTYYTKVLIRQSVQSIFPGHYFEFISFLSLDVGDAESEGNRTPY